MRTRVLLVALVVVLATPLAACSSGTGNTRTIQVDFNYDEFAGSFIGYFPHEVTVRPGSTVKFHQTWTGAPHTVTFGTAIDENLEPLNRDFFKTQLPKFFRENKTIGQDAARPCFVKTLDQLPLDHAACKAADRVKPAFDGTYAYYSSGLILPTGPNANSFTLKIAPDTKPGTYAYYCAVHGLGQLGRLTISKTAAVASQRELNRRARTEAKELAAPVLAEFRKERKGQTPFAGNLAGSGDPTAQAVAAEVNEFTPETIYTNVGSKVSWTFVGNHTISFNVPRFTPLFTTDDDGIVIANDELDQPAGGWPGAPPGHLAYPALTADNVHLDAGAFDGSGGLKSSGIGFNTGDTYAVTFTKRGTYPFACLIHPGMIGKVVVK
jgi:plastocyanin